MKIPKINKIYILGISAPIIVIFIIFIGIIGIKKSNEIIDRQTARFTYNHIEEIEKNEFGLLLGTSKQTLNNRENLYFNYRIKAATELYKSGKITKILVSGDNGEKGYDEPTDIKNSLVGAGIPEEKIFLDYAGFRTLDSIVRAKKIFGLKRFTIISQKFHNQRAIFIAKHYAIEAIGFNAEDVKGPSSYKTNLREKLARVKTILDLYVFKTEPKYLGEQIKIS